MCRHSEEKRQISRVIHLLPVSIPRTIDELREKLALPSIRWPEDFQGSHDGVIVGVGRESKLIDRKKQVDI